MNIHRNISHFASARRSLSFACNVSVVCLSLLGCNAPLVRPSTEDSSVDGDVAAQSTAESGADANLTDDAANADSLVASDASASYDTSVTSSDASVADSRPPPQACVSTAAPTCGDSLPQARMLYEFRSGIAPLAPGGEPSQGCYLATTLVSLGGAFGYGPTSMRVVRTSATTGVIQVQAEREGSLPPFRVDLGYDTANASSMLDVRCPLEGFSAGRHRYAVRPNGSIELHWIENGQVTGYMVFDRCAATPSGGCS
ncbi:MAG: hypothetical protein U0269_31560 [Polyangiales bacterium]